MDGWKTFIYEELQKRNIKEKECYQSVFDAYNKLLIRENSLQQRIFSLERDIATLRQNVIITPQQIDTSDSSDLVKQLQTRILTLSQELTDAYKLKSENSDAILRFKEEIHKTESLLIQKEEKLDEVESELKKSNEKILNLNKSNNELTTNNCLLREEIGQYKKILEKNENKTRVLKDENKKLLENILKGKERSANELNEMNSVCNSLRQQLDNQNRNSSKTLLSNTLTKLGNLNVNLKNKQEKTPDLNRYKYSDKINKNNFDFDLPRTAVIPTSPKRRVISHSGQVTSVSFDKDGKHLISSGDDKIIRIWDILGNPISTLLGSVSTIMNTSFSPNALLVLGTTSIGNIIVWDVETSRIIHNLTGHSNKVYSALFTLDSKQIISGGHDRTIKIWDVYSGYCKRSIICFSSCNYIDISNNGNTLVSGHMDGHIRIWSIRTGELLKDLNLHTQQVTSVQFSFNGSQILSNSKDGSLKLVDVNHYKIVQIFTHKDYINKINWNRSTISPDGSYVLAGTNSGSLIFWNAHTGKFISKLEGHQSTVTCTDWSNSGRVISCDTSGFVIYWE